MAIEVAVPAMAGIPVHVRHLAVACTIAPAGGAPLARDAARTLVVVTDDLRAAAASMAATGDPDVPAAAIDQAGDVTRAALAALTHLAPPRPGVLVAGAVADTARVPAASR